MEKLLHSILPTSVAEELSAKVSSHPVRVEAVNIASRYESSGIAGGINVSKCTYLLTKNFSDYRAHGEVEIKGGEKTEMYELLGVKE